MQITKTQLAVVALCIGLLTGTVLALAVSSPALKASGYLTTYRGWDISCKANGYYISALGQSASGPFDNLETAIGQIDLEIDWPQHP